MVILLSNHKKYVLKQNPKIMRGVRITCDLHEMLMGILSVSNGSSAQWSSRDGGMGDRSGDGGHVRLGSD